MLKDDIRNAQKQNEEAMIGLIKKFNPLFIKYARKLNYEDAYEDIILCYIELIKSIDINKLISQKDETIVSYINISIINFYNKKVRKLIEKKQEIVLSDLTKEQTYYTESLSAKVDKTNIFIEYGIRDLLNENEYKIIYLVYMEGYTTAEIARILNKSRQAVNQLKQRALKKLKNI